METDLTKISGIGASTADFLKDNGYLSVEDIANADIEKLTKVRGFSVGRAEKVIQQAKAVLTGESTSVKGARKKSVVDAKPEIENKEQALSENSQPVVKEKDKKKKKDKKKDKKKVKKNKKKDKKKKGKKKKSKGKSRNKKAKK